MTLLFLFIAIAVYLILATVDYVAGNNQCDCEHIHQVTYDSYNKTVCIDCLKEFKHERKTTKNSTQHS